MNKKRHRTLHLFSIILLITAVIAVALLIVFITKSKNTKLESENKNANESIVTDIAKNTTSQVITKANITTTKSTTIKVTTTKPAPTPVPDYKANNFKVRALYLTASTASNTDRLDSFIKLAENTEINSYVIDIKDDTGFIFYDSQVELALENNAIEKKYNAIEMLNRFHEKNIRVIGRIVCFNDALMATAKPDLSIKTSSGDLFKINLKNSYYAWLNPSNKATWKYIGDIAEEAVKLGFDEIQLDYVRFPESWYDYDLGETDKKNSEYINEFLAYIKGRIPNTHLSADIFGYVVLAKSDEGIGQSLEGIIKTVDSICPMIYPSHYANDSSNHYSGNGVGTKINGYTYPKPDLDPYNIIFNVLKNTNSRLTTEFDTDVITRPYLQGFTATYLPDGYYMNYTSKEFREQIQAVYDAGFEQWIFWNSRNIYDENAFIKENE